MCQITDRYWSEIKKDAEKREIEFRLTREQAWRLFLIQNGRCKLTNLKIDLTSKGYRGTASLDRINSSKPYTIENVEWVLDAINIMCGAMQKSQFRELCYYVAHPVVLAFDERPLFIR